MIFCLLCSEPLADHSAVEFILSKAPSWLGQEEPNKPKQVSTEASSKSKLYPDEYLHQGMTLSVIKAKLPLEWISSTEE